MCITLGNFWAKVIQFWYVIFLWSWGGSLCTGSIALPRNSNCFSLFFCIFHFLLYYSYLTALFMPWIALNKQINKCMHILYYTIYMYIFTCLARILQSDKIVTVNFACSYLNLWSKHLFCSGVILFILKSKIHVIDKINLIYSEYK